MVNAPSNGTLPVSTLPSMCQDEFPFPNFAVVQALLGPTTGQIH